MIIYSVLEKYYNYDDQYYYDTEGYSKIKKHFTEKSDADAYKAKLDLDYIKEIESFEDEIRYDNSEQYGETFVTINIDKFENFLKSKDKFVKSLKLDKEKIKLILKDVENFGVLENKKIHELFKILYEKGILKVNLYEIVTAELSNIFS